MDRYHYMTSKDTGVRYYGCSLECKTCVEWGSHGQTWKIIYWFPLHCHICESTMEEDEPYILQRCLICKACNIMMERKKRHHYIKYRIEIYGHTLERAHPWRPIELRK